MYTLRFGQLVDLADILGAIVILFCEQLNEPLLDELGWERVYSVNCTLTT